VGQKPNWSEEELAILRDNMTLPDKVLAEKLGRSRIAITGKKSRLRHNFTSTSVRKPKGQEFDTRPSGWYTETIGTLLLHYPDAFESWKHFHRYVEIIEVGTDLGSWTHLLCRRAAEA
jgi:hypothetical protein